MIQRPKGTYDVYGENGKKIRKIEQILEALMDKYNYEFVQTPIFESTELFKRGVGETTDIVSKETYDFLDKSDRKMTLRPEGTAGVVRSFIENKLYINGVFKSWYFGPMFRYERPQSGRFREFYQFGVESFGISSPLMDAEVISIPVNFYKMLGLKEIKVNINSLGDKESRENYKQALLDYFKPYLSELCPDCQDRYIKNPLRIIDCKADAHLEIMKNIPNILDYLSEESKANFELLQTYLKDLDIDFIVNPRIVRGLDYYTDMVFEVEANIESFGSQNVLCAGGRYDNLVENIGGVTTPGVGFALGLERLLNAIEAENIDLDINNSLDVYVIPFKENIDYAFSLVNSLRLNGFSTDMEYNPNKITNSFKKADKCNTKFIIIIGEEEEKTNLLTVKDNKTKEELKISIDDLVDYLDTNI